MHKPILVVSAHSADFVWRAAGAIARRSRAEHGPRRRASYGERGESGGLWKEPGQTEERVKEIRRGRRTAASALGADFRGFDLGDYPLVMDAAAVDRLTGLIRELEPQVILTHAARDPFNPDHGARTRRRSRRVRFARRRRRKRVRDGRAVGAAAVRAAPPELCGFVPSTFLDITPVWEKKVAAMEAMGARSTCGSTTPSARSTVRTTRGGSRVAGTSAARRRSSASSRSWSTRCERLRGSCAARVATVHEAAGKTGLVDIPLTQLVGGSRVAGPARTALCASGDNTMVHALVADANPGDVLVFTSVEPTPVALMGDLLATQAQTRGAAGILVDGAVRDVDELAAIGLPIWARLIRAKGATKGVVGSSTFRSSSAVSRSGRET